MRSILTLVLASFVSFIILATPCPAKIDLETAIAVYLFDDEKVNEVEDHSGKGHTGTFQGGVGKWEDGKFGSAIDTRNGWVSVDDADDLHATDALTIVAWFNLENIGEDITNTIVTKWDEYILRVDRSGAGNNLSIYVKPGGNWEPRAKGGVPDPETWTHGALVWDNKENGVLKVYKDGVETGQSSRPGEIAATTNPLCIGSQTGGAIFQGLIDEVGIFNVPLEEDDIKFIMENGLGKIIAGGASVEPQTGLAARWGELKIR